MLLHVSMLWSSHMNCYSLFCILVWKKCAVLLCVYCPLMFYVMLHCLHHVDFLRIVQSWISTNGRHSHMKERSGDLRQHDADAGDEGTLWPEDIDFCVPWILVQRRTQRTRWKHLSRNVLIRRVSSLDQSKYCFVSHWIENVFRIKVTADYSLLNLKFGMLDRNISAIVIIIIIIHTKQK